MLRYRRAQFAAWIGLSVNLVLGVGKILVGAFAHSEAVVADGVHSLSDCATSVAVLIGLIIASRPADSGHPYGHGRAESIAGKIVAIVLMVVAVLLAYNAIHNIATSREANIPGYAALWAALASIVIKESLFWYKSRVAKETGSVAIEADAWHHRSDSYSSMAVFVGVIAAIIGGQDWAVLDRVAAIVVAVIIFVVGLRLFAKTWRELMDAAAPEATIEKVRRLAREVEGVRGIEKVLTRKSGLDLFVDIHIAVDPEISVRDGHDIAGAVKQHLIEKMVPVKGVLVHIEPHSPDPPRVERNN